VIFFHWLSHSRYERCLLSILESLRSIVIYLNASKSSQSSWDCSSLTSFRNVWMNHLHVHYKKQTFILSDSLRYRLLCISISIRIRIRNLFFSSIHFVLFKNLRWRDLENNQRMQHEVSDVNENKKFIQYETSANLKEQIEWSSSWAKPTQSKPTYFISGVEHPTLFNDLGWIDRSVWRPNPTHRRGAQTLFEKKVKKINLLIWSFYDQKNQQNFFSKKKLSKNTPKIEALYLIRLVSDSLGKPMGWALMGWKNSIWKPNPIELTLMGWAGTFVQNLTRRSL
jgi:hypothetical protein